MLKVTEQILKEQEENRSRKKQYIKQNTLKWLEKGELLRQRREKHNMSMRKVGELLGTSASRIRNIENGSPVYMADHLTKCYNLLFDYIELQAGLIDLQKSHDWRG